MSEPLSWTASHFARQLILLTGVALGLAFAFARPELVVLAAVPAMWLAVAPRRFEPGELDVEFAFPSRCSEDEPIPITISARCATSMDLIRLSLTPGPGLHADTPPLSITTADTDRATLRTALVAPRWGRRELGHVTIECWARNRLRHAVRLCKPRTDIAVYPHPAALRRLPVTSVRYDRTGDHPAPVEGSGVEFHSVRRFTTGDRPKRVNWPVSTRRGQLYVTTTRAEQAVDVVIAIDVLTDTGPPGRSSRDLALRGATGVAQTALRAHDRVGLVAIGGRLHWLRPDHTQRQFYRITEAILDVVDWESYLEPSVDTIPYTALPFGARVVYFSPLVDERGVDAARILNARGHPTTVVDVCNHEPPAQHDLEQLTLRLWRLDRTATRNQLTSLGITVTDWDGHSSLDATLGPFLNQGSAMIERTLIGLPGLLALAAGAALAGGLLAALVGAVAVIPLCAGVVRPGWAAARTLIATALLVQVGVADERAWWRVLIVALLLAIVLAAGEMAQSGALRAGWTAAFLAHRRAYTIGAIGVAILTGAALTDVHDATLATLLVGLATTSALLVLIVLREALR